MRRSIFDTQKQIPVKEFRRQLESTGDIIKPGPDADLAPATKEAMRFLKVGDVAALFTSPGRRIGNVSLSSLFSNHLVMVAEGTDDGGNALTPLPTDLRIERSAKVECRTQSAQDSVRLIKMGNLPESIVRSMFRGFNNPPVFRRYKAVRSRAARGRPFGGGKVAKKAVSKPIPHFKLPIEFSRPDLQFVGSNGNIFTVFVEKPKRTPDLSSL